MSAPEAFDDESPSVRESLRPNCNTSGLSGIGGQSDEAVGKSGEALGEQLPMATGATLGTVP